MLFVVVVCCFYVVADVGVVIDGVVVGVHGVVGCVVVDSGVGVVGVVGVGVVVVVVCRCCCC